MLDDLPELARAVFDFIIYGVIVKYVIAKWLARLFTKYFKKYIVQTARERAIWTHYIEHAVKHGHRPKSPLKCEDGACKLV